jgi:hypothetical protein
MRFLLPLLLLPACGPLGTTTEHYADVGMLCLYDAETTDTQDHWHNGGAGTQEQDFEADQPVIASVHLHPGCLSIDCDSTWVSVSASVEAEAIVVTAEGEVTTDHACRPDDDCGQLGATVTTDPLLAGSYTVEYGAASGTLVVPSAGTFCLEG